VRITEVVQDVDPAELAPRQVDEAGFFPGSARTVPALRAADGCLRGEDLMVPGERGGLCMCRLRE
jgi:hypothetical protein